jgi:hypothetical protein
MATFTVTKGYNTPDGFVSGEVITPAKLNSAQSPAVALTAGTIVAGDIASDAVTTAKILDANVTTAKIADDAVTNDKLSLAANAGEVKKALNADNSPPIYACRAWVNFDGARNEADTGGSTNGANVKIRASGNVSSVLKNDIGDYTVTFTTAMPDANYSVIGMGPAISGVQNVGLLESVATGARASNSIRVVNVGEGILRECASASIAILR